MSDADRGATLVKLARDAIAEHFGARQPPLPHEPWLDVPGATFVTLMQNGSVRGCIGSLQAYRPLWEDVQANAVAAAFRDYRFDALREDEFPYTSVEVSLLSPSQPLVFDCEQAALAQLRPGVDGVIFECGHHRSTFLPQVWEKLPDAEAFMAELKYKAGLSEDFWSPEVRLSRYSVQKWKEIA